MARERSDLTPNKLRQVELPTAWRGYDIGAARELLERVATVWDEVFTERTELQKRVEELEASIEAQRDSERELTRVLGAAGKAAEDLVAEAEQDAAKLRAQAERERAEARRTKEVAAEEGEAARAAAERLRADVAADLERLREHGYAFRRAILSMREQLAELSAISEVMLTELEAFESGVAEASSSEPHADEEKPSLVSDLDASIWRGADEPARHD